MRVGEDDGDEHEQDSTLSGGSAACMIGRGTRAAIGARCSIDSVRTTCAQDAVLRMTPSGDWATIGAMTSNPHPSSILVADAMRPGILTCRARTPLREVAGLMAMRRVHCVLVRGVDPAAPATLAVLADLDLARATGDGALDDVTAGDIAGSPLITVSPDTTLQHAAGLMARYAATHLVVIRPGMGAPVGVLSTLDVAAALAGLQSPGPAPAAASS
jgi:CBS domain-containing protein